MFLFLCKDFFDEQGSPHFHGDQIPATGVGEDQLSHIGRVFSSTSDDFNTHKGE